VLRLAGAVDLVVPSVLAFFLAATATGCGGTALSSADSGAADGAPAVEIPGVTGLVAGNGVPIPDPPLQDPCATLGVAAMTCGPTDACPAITCSCGGAQQRFEVSGSCMMFGACLTGVSCPAACSHSDLVAAGNLSACVQAGVCLTDQDCINPTSPHCLRGLDGGSGHCVSGQRYSECYGDADCASATCVAVGGTSRVCIDKDPICNRNDQCGAPASGTGKMTCVLPPGGFTGTCTDGRQGAACVTPDDCLSGDACAVLDQGSVGTCTSRVQGAPCAVNGDCAQGRCVDVGNPNPLGVCETGELGTSCLKPSDCLAGFCGNAVCTTGANGAVCLMDGDCATHLCASVGPPSNLPGQCTDGMQGSPCWGPYGKQCAAGLVCQGMGGAGTCIAAGSVGAPCQQDSDCLAQKCAKPMLPIPNLAACTEGKRGQRCHDSSQCDAGLHCLSNGTLGVCVAGAPGDPCRGAGDCASGTCQSLMAPPAPSCTGVADLGSCGMGACVAGLCLPLCL
jgi:hypothetical protein